MAPLKANQQCDSDERGEPLHLSILRNEMDAAGWRGNEKQRPMGSRVCVRHRDGHGK